MATKRVNIDIVAKDKSQQALNKVRGSLDRVKQSVFNVRNALAGLGAGLVIRNLVNTGKELENLQTRLKKDQIPKICRNSKRAAQKDDKILQKVQSNKESLRSTIKTMIKIVYFTDQG